MSEGSEGVDIPIQLCTIEHDAPIYTTIQAGVQLLVLGGPLVGKTTLISAGINDSSILSWEKAPAYTVKFNSSNSTVSEISGLNTFNKKRGQVWRSVVEFIKFNKIEAVWFCTTTDFPENNDEMWHWISVLLQICHVIIVRTKCLSPSDSLLADTARKFPSNTPPVVCVMAQDMQLNPKGGGAIVEGYGIDDLVQITNDQLQNKLQVTDYTFSKLLKQVKSDEERYAVEEERKGVLVNALRSLSSTENESTTPPQKDPLAEEEFVFVPREQSDEPGFVKQVLSSKKTKTAVGAIVAFAVIRIISQQSS